MAHQYEVTIEIVMCCCYCWFFYFHHILWICCARSHNTKEVQRAEIWIEGIALTYKKKTVFVSFLFIHSLFHGTISYSYAMNVTEELCALWNWPKCNYKIYHSAFSLPFSFSLPVCGHCICVHTMFQFIFSHSSAAVAAADAALLLWLTASAHTLYRWFFRWVNKTNNRLTRNVSSPQFGMCVRNIRRWHTRCACILPRLTHECQNYLLCFCPQSQKNAKQIDETNVTAWEFNNDDNYCDLIRISLGVNKKKIRKSLR